MKMDHSDGFPCVRGDGHSDDVKCKSPVGAVDAANIRALTGQPRQHPLDEYCFNCVPDEIVEAGVSSMDKGQAYTGPTVHWQVPFDFCPHYTAEDGE